MSQVIGVFGAGPGLGRSVARRFGSEGYRVALVGRRAEAVESLAEELSGAGVDATAFTADFVQPGSGAAAVEAIVGQLGRLDVVEYAPIAMDMAFTPARDLQGEARDTPLQFYYGTLVEIVQAALPGMLERGSGAILAASGPSAVRPSPGMSGHGPAMAAARNYLHTLHAELADEGIQVATLVVNAIVERSAGYEALTTGEMAMDPKDLPLVDPDELADVYWRLVSNPELLDITHPPAAS